MLKRVENIKLRSQVFFFICVSASVVVLLQVTYITWFELINTRNYSVFLQDTVNQLEMKALSFSEEIDTIANITSFNDLTFQFINSQDIDERLKLKNNMQVMIDSIKLSNKSVSSIIITNLDMIHIGADRSEDFWVLGAALQLYRTGSIPADRPRHFIMEGHESGKPFYACITRSFPPVGSDGQYITVVVYNPDSFAGLVSSIQTSDQSVFRVSDTNGNPIAANRIAPAGGGDALIYERTVERLHWRIVGMTPDAAIAKDMSALKQFAFLTGAIVIVALFGCGLMINRSITSPIIRIAHFMKSIGQNYGTQRLSIHNNNEISLLARLLNKMLDNIGEMTSEVVASQEKLYKAELAKKHAQFAAFQSQVNPHFLYNTLDCIRSIALARDVPEIFAITTSMAKIFRYSIKENNDVPVRDELECIREYFNIIRIRQSNRLAIAYEVEEAIMSRMIPKMILQPIVENAVFHGLERKKGPGTLIVRGYEQGGALLFEIEDDGLGMPPEVIERIAGRLAAWDPAEDALAEQEKKSIGLTNIDRRIKLLYGARYGVTVSSRRQEGTRVAIALPAETRKPKIV